MVDYSKEVHNELRDTGGALADVRSDRFGAAGNGVTNDRAAIAAADALDAPILFSYGTYRVATSNLTIASPTFFLGGVIKPASGITVTLSREPQAASIQIFDESLGGVVTLSEYDSVNVCWYGCSASLSAAANTTIIKGLLLRYRSITIPAFVDWNGYVDTQAETGQTISYDHRHRQLIIGGQVLRFPKDETKGYIANMPFMRGAADAGLWSMPNGPITAAGGPAPRPAGKHAVFLDDYGEVAASPDSWGNVDYRDGTLIGNVHEGSLGFGVIRLQFKSNGRFIPFAPEGHISLFGSSQTPMRIVRVQPNPSVAGNFFTPDPAEPYTFNYEMPIWKPGKAVTQGQLINEAGKIYEAQSAGTTGSTPVIHATYRKKQLALTGVTGTFVVGETVKQGVGDVPNGDIETLPGGGGGVDGDYLLQYWNQQDFSVGQVVTGQTSGATGTIASITDVDVDIDNNDNNFVPPGPPVAGRIESDGAIDWMFLDNIIGYIRAAESMKGIVILGDDAAQLPFVGFNDVGTHFIEDALFYPGKRLRFADNTGEEADAGYGRSSNNKLELKGPSPSNGEVHIYGRHGQPGYLRVLGTQITANAIPFVMATGTAKASGATTYDMGGGNYVVFSDAGATSFTGFTNMRTGQPFWVRVTTGNTTFVHSANLQMPGGVNYTPPANTTLQFFAHGTTTCAIPVGA